ncbi:PAS/PAC sensor hybrid histidine kinase [Olavius algarvensis associated proteobacterium Delta 3]|nr:PAS/PAC sensor hybrid histidine kinase [Olavius algarvensis associated proteobacterium Delta 3]
MSFLAFFHRCFFPGKFYFSEFYYKSNPSVPGIFFAASPDVCRFAPLAKPEPFGKTIKPYRSLQVPIGSMENLKQSIWNIIASGLPASYDIESLRKICLLNIIILLGIFFLGIFGSIAFIQQERLLGTADGLVFGFLVGLFTYLRRTKRIDRVATVGTIAMCLFYGFLFAHGGVGNSAYVWVFTYPLISLFLVGIRRGTWLTFLLLAFCILVFSFGPDVSRVAVYNSSLIPRFVSAYLIIFLFSFMMEKVRIIVQQRLTMANGKKELALVELRKKTDKLLEANLRLLSEMGERKHAEEALQQSESFFEDVIESIQDGICVLNPDLTIRHVNHVMDSWYRNNGTLIGKKCYVCFRGKERPCDPCPAHRSLESGKVERELICGRPGSDVEWIELYTYPIKDRSSGEITGIVEFVRNTTERKRLEAKLNQAERMDSIGRLAGGIAHDFNNLLMGIQGRVSLMAFETTPDHPFYDHLKSLEDYVCSASGLTRQLLGFARGGKYEIQITDINKLLEENLVMFSRTKKELTISSAFQEDVLPVEVDQGQIKQVILNLLVNAWEAMAAGGEITVLTENACLDPPAARQFNLEPGRYVKIAVSDTGVGMSDTVQIRIFDPFFTPKERDRGTGLGLASAYGIIENHKGIITVKSKPDKGTTFVIYLPASEKAVTERKKLPDTLYPGEGTILLVDDEALMIDVGRPMLEKLGYDVVVADSGTSALTILTEPQGQRIDLVILDLVMPHMDGSTAYDRIKEVRPDIKVLLSSGYSINGRAHDILRRGCNGFIQKPFNPVQLSIKLREIMHTNTLPISTASGIERPGGSSARTGSSP